LIVPLNPPPEMVSGMPATVAVESAVKVTVTLLLTVTPLPAETTYGPLPAGRRTGWLPEQFAAPGWLSEKLGGDPLLRANETSQPLAVASRCA
jgi:hypothetical protein